MTMDGGKERCLPVKENKDHFNKYQNACLRHFTEMHDSYENFSKIKDKNTFF